MKERIRICVDAMGGDHAPSEIVRGALAALSDQRLHLLLTGPAEILESELQQQNAPRDRVEIIPAEEVIGTDEVPTTALRQKKNASLAVGLRWVKEKKAHAFLSAGNTGALMAGAILLLGRLEGVERPTLATQLPNRKGFSLLVDSGANVDCKPVYLVQFAQMGVLYLRNVLGVPNPTVGLVNIGAEREKGNTLVKEVYPLLENTGLSFIGNVEPRDIPFGAADILVCDGFVGNVILKYSEGFSKELLGMLQEELSSMDAVKTQASGSMDALRNLKKKFDDAEIGGAPLLGVKAPVIKAHGQANAKAIQNALHQCLSFVSEAVIQKMEALSPDKGFIRPS